MPVVGAVCRAETRHVVALCEALLPRIIGGPASKLSEFGQRYMEFAAGGFVVGCLVEQLGDHSELLLG